MKRLSSSPLVADAHGVRQRGRVRPALMWGVVALALVAGGGLWWWNKRAPAQGEQASAGAPGPGGGRAGGG
ncbi:efflux transporter periplasmic adaptor subunit, partial [Delftia tsuruhatensis]|nr:efflux transporter periplasmic adaptor subunit [Delftia tsuruhatensis]